MTKREQKRKATRRTENTTSDELEPTGRSSTASGSQESGSLDLAETDELMDEIDKILESDLVAKEYVQKGGE